MFGLVSKHFIVLLGFFALVVCGVVVWLWPRLAGNDWRRVLGRIGMLLAAQVMVLATIASVVNAYFGFYTTWGELFGTASTRYTLTDHAAGKADPPLQLTLVDQTPAINGKTPAVGGESVSLRLRGRSTGLTAPLTVYLPPQYFQAGQEKTTFPVVLLLADTPAAAPRPADLTALIGAGRLTPMVIATVPPTTDRAAGVPCTDVPAGAGGESFLSTDVPAALAARYRVAANANRWGVLGVGADGGYCAVKLGLRHSDQFPSVAALDPSLRAPAGTRHTYGESDSVRQENDPLWRLANLPPPPASMLLLADPTDQSDLTAFQAAAKAPLLVSSEPAASCQGGALGLLAWLGERLDTGTGQATNAGCPSGAATTSTAATEGGVR